jgi:hypothetical protein
VAGSCEYGDGPSGSDATELVSSMEIRSAVVDVRHDKANDRVFATVRL